SVFLKIVSLHYIFHTGSVQVPQSFVHEETQPFAHKKSFRKRRRRLPLFIRYDIGLLLEINHDRGSVRKSGLLYLRIAVHKLMTYHLAFSYFFVKVRNNFRSADVFLQLYFHISVEDRKSTRLNSSHVSISYDEFCLCKITDKLTLISL